jgi:hypothetical protein
VKKLNVARVEAAARAIAKADGWEIAPNVDLVGSKHPRSRRFVALAIAALRATPTRWQKRMFGGATYDQ